MRIEINRPKEITSASGMRDITTVGYWMVVECSRCRVLHIDVKPLPDWRYSLAVIGHELIEAFYCLLRGISTSTCDAFDDQCEREFELGTRDPMGEEPGFDPKCPYRIGHILGSWWERLVIHLTFASWKKYDHACNVAMKLE